MRVLIAGCGYVGRRLGARLATEGNEVLGLKRRSSKSLEAPFETIVGDLTELRTLRAIPAGLDAVVYAASPDSAEDSAYEQAYVVGVRTLLQLFEERGESLRRFILTTSTGVYEGADGEWVDETTPAEAEHAAARRMLEGERLVHASGHEAAVIRLAGIYGPERTRLLESVRGGRARRPPDPRWTNRIHVEDCAGAIAHLLGLAAIEPRYVGVDLEPAELGEVQRWLASRLGVPAPPLGEAVDDERRGRSNKRCRPSALLRAGYVFRYPTYREGYAEMLAP